MKDISVCFSGHRIIPCDERKRLKFALGETIEKLYDRGFKNFFAGGALGFDTQAALAVLSAKKTHDDIRLFLILPCPEQADKWRAVDKAVYAAIISDADSVSYAAPHYVTGCMQLRNRLLVESAAVCVCYLKNGGGTEYTVKRAVESGLEIINLA